MDIRSRLRDDDDRQHRAAYLELFLHELFIRAGYAILCHPVVPGLNSPPDFLISRSEASFFVEATMPGPTGDPAKHRRERDFLETLERTANRNYFLTILALRSGARPARGQLARAKLDAWLASLPDSTGPEFPGPIFEWEDHGWSIRLAAHSVSAALRAEGGYRILAVEAHHSAQFVDDASPMRRALGKKHGRYPGLPHPLVIALGTYTWDGDHDGIITALYGNQHYVLREAHSGEDVVEHVYRDGTGSFGSPGKWRSTDFAGVLCVDQLAPYRPHGAELSLLAHPGSAARLDSLAHRLPATIIALDDQHLAATPPTMNAAEVLGIDQPWPIGDAFPRH